jgi:hypothetical protein
VEQRHFAAFGPESLAHSGSFADFLTLDRVHAACPASAGRPLSHEVVERTSDAHLDGVTLDRLFASLEFQQFGARRRTGSARGQPRAKDVGDFDEFDVTADRTGLAGFASEILRRAK